jgi:inorganic pyrophosphatase
MMYDEKGADEKIFVVPVDEIDKYNAMPENELQKIRANIKWFFSNYKLQEEDKWSRVDRFLTVEESENLYSESVYRFFKTHL